jgi:hypothetical protein
MKHDFSRRHFLAASGAALAGIWTPPASGAAGAVRFPRESSVGAAIRAGQPLRIAAAASLPIPAGGLDGVGDLRRRFVFEYYPWWGRDPFVHWNQWDREPPHDLAAQSVPLLGPYDSRDLATLETHARWINETGVGAINLSWWGPGSYEDLATHRVMDVMRDHDIRVAFHLESYASDRGTRFADDALYILQEYGEKRGWDALLLLPDPRGGVGPVFKGFRTIVPPDYVDCHGRRLQVSDYTSDALWAEQIARLRRAVSSQFDGLTLLADSLDWGRTRISGFDGVAIYDNFIPPAAYAGYAREASDWDLVFSFNVNPGFDSIEPREPFPDCYAPQPFHPPGPSVDWFDATARELAALRARERIRESLAATLAVQLDPSLANARDGFFLVYLNSFNEWHEGHAFEPAKDRGMLLPEELAFPYHNPVDGRYRIDELGEQLRPLLRPRLEAVPLPAG